MLGKETDIYTKCIFRLKYLNEKEHSSSLTLEYICRARLRDAKIAFRETASAPGDPDLKRSVECEVSERRPL